MIKSFKCKETEKIWNEEFSKKLPQDIQKRALKKLMMLRLSKVRLKEKRFKHQLNQYSIT